MGFRHSAICAVGLLVWGAACSPPAPKQVAPPRIEDSGEEDIGVEPEKEMEPAAKETDEMTEQERLGHCCAQCEKGLAEDRTGQKADQIPCADFTANLEEGCLNYFRNKPMKASECQGKGTPPDKGKGGPADKPPAKKK